MRRMLPLLFTAVAVFATTTAHAQLTLPRASAHAVVTQTVGITDLTLTYSRPGVKGRAIWGALVPYDKPWRTGANEITQFTTADTIQVEGQTLPAGTYGLVTIPSADQWIVAFTKDKDMWGAFDYTADHDQLRVSVKPQTSTESQEWMRFTIEPGKPGEADVVLAWEKLRLPFHVTVDVNAKVLREARTAIAAAKPDDSRTFLRAASWAFDNQQVPTEAAAWSATALQREKNFSTLALAAKFAQRAGQKKEAIAQMTQAIALAKADKKVEAEEIAPLEKLLAEWKSAK
jgi:hypothetical protein